MLWLGERRIPDVCGVDSRTYSFSLDGVVYLLDSDEFDGEDSMIALHPTSLTTQKVNVISENFSTSYLFARCAIEVYQNTVILWSAENCQLYIGRKVPSGFAFRLFETTGCIPESTGAFAHCLYKGNLIFLDGSDYLYELELNTRIWTRRPTAASSEVEKKLIKTMFYLCDNILIGERLHIISSDSSDHFVLDLKTGVWRDVSNSEASGSEMPEYSRKFAFNGDLYTLGSRNRDPTAIFRFEERDSKWKEITSDFSAPFPYHGLTLNGSRLYIWKRADFKCSWMKVAVLELSPTLTDWAMLALRKTAEGRKVMEEVVPASVKELIVCSDEQ